MRSHGLPSFPDPDSTGSIPKTQVASLRRGDPTLFDAAEGKCGRLLPAGGGNGETPVEIAQDWSQDRLFAKCMRRNGVPNWPDPTDRSPNDTRPVFRITAVGLDGNSPQLRAKARQCVTQLHTNGLPVAG
jgi:hypothetical protein